ncbi:unnamed protein product, partial [Allacma fusca]
SIVIFIQIKSLPPIIQRWFQQAGKVLQIPQPDTIRCTIALQNINANHFGLQAKLFTITFGTIGGILGLIITNVFVVAPMQFNPAAQLTLEYFRSSNIINTME